MKDQDEKFGEYLRANRPEPKPPRADELSRIWRAILAAATERRRTSWMLLPIPAAVAALALLLILPRLAPVHPAVVDELAANDQALDQALTLSFLEEDESPDWVEALDFEND